MMSRLNWAIFVALLPMAAYARNEAVLYETKSEALIYRSSTFTVGIERRNIPIPAVIDIRMSPDFRGLTSDSKSGWTNCRVPLKGELGITGVTERSLVFDCRPIK
jgi:hypothetical protein